VPGTCPVVTYKIPGAKGTIGFIAPLGRKFCSTCNRLRLTSDGFLRTCLLNDDEITVRDSLYSKQQMLEKFELAARLKPESHHMELGYHPAIRSMGQIGG
jgi:GTP 3',8-cyclase